MPPLPPAHVGLIGPFHESRKKKEAPPGRTATNSQYRRAEPGRRGGFSTGRRAHKQASIRGASAVLADASVVSTGKSSTAVETGVERSHFPANCILFVHVGNNEAPIVGAPGRCYARTLARSRKRSLPAAWSPQPS